MKLTLAVVTAAAAATAVLASLVVSGPAADAVKPRDRSAAAPYDIKPFTTYPKDDDRLEEAWAAWLARDADRYVTVVTRYCFCPEEPDVRTRVRGDRVTSVRHVGERGQLDRRGHEIETFYRLLRRAFREADSVDVRFRDGVPVRIAVDWDELIVDEEVSYRVRLRQLPSPDAPSAHAAARPAAAPYDIKPFSTRASDDDRLERAWAAWEERGLGAYVTAVSQSCECLPTGPLRTTVEDGTVTKVRQDGEDYGRHGYEVEALYRLLRKGYRSADSVEVTYRRGVPVWLYIDWDEGIADEETVLSVRLRAS